MQDRRFLSLRAEWPDLQATYCSSTERGTPQPFASDAGDPAFSPDGRRVIAFPVRADAAETGSVHVRVLLNFFDELEAESAVGRGK